MDTARSLFSNLPLPAECFALLIGLAEFTIFGLGGLASPAKWAKGFGVHYLSPQSTSEKRSDATVASTAESQESKKVQDTQKALITATAARNVQNGLLILIFGALLRDRKALGIITGLGLITTTTDYLTVKKHGIKEAAGGHLIGIFNCIVIGGSLLYWGRNDAWW